MENKAVNNENFGELAIFENEKFGQLRWKMRDGEPWFVANDIAERLGYARPDKAVIDHCKHAELLRGPESGTLTTNPYGIKVIPESDVYRLIFRSNLPIAEEFEEWVTGEVLPSIRKTGKYATPNTSDPISVHEKIRLAEKAMDTAGMGKTMRLLILDSIIQKSTGFKVLEACHMDIAKASGEPELSPKQIAEMLGPSYGEIGVRMILGEMGLQEYIMREWQLTAAGREYGADFPPTLINRRKGQWSDYNIKWRPAIVDLIKLHLGITFNGNDVLVKDGDFSL